MYKLVAFDMDKTLTYVPTAEFCAQKLGFIKKAQKTEKDYAQGKISVKQIQQFYACQFKNILNLDLVESFFQQVPKIKKIKETISKLQSNQMPAIIASIGPHFFVELFCQEYGFLSGSGVKLEFINRRCTGIVEQYCSPKDKLKFVQEVCQKMNLDLASEVVAIGDSRSDIPLFEKSALAIALNADFNLDKKANIALKTDNLLDILKYIL